MSIHSIRPANRLRVAAILAGTLLVLTAGPVVAAPRPVSEGTLITRLGDDTLTVERFTRFADRVTGRVVRRVPRTTLLDYDVAIRGDGHPSSATFKISPAPGATLPAARTLRFTFRADSTVSEEMRDTLVRRAWPLPNAFLSMGDSYGLGELWLTWFRGVPTDTATLIGVAPLGGAASGRSPIRQGKKDSVYVMLPTGSFKIVADKQGRLHSLDGTDSPVKHRVTRVKSADLDGFAARAAALDAQGKAFGTWVSPRDTVKARIGACSLWVDYGRPSKRGRKVFENGVLGDSLWRTGANAATQFFTSRELVLDGRILPSGRYTLWTRVTGDRYALLVNSQTGQWGTVHDSARDLLMLPLEKRALSPAVEMFTIRVEADGDTRGRLRLQWDDAELVLPFEVTAQN